MKQMKEDLLDHAVKAIHATEPSASELSASMQRTTERLNTVVFVAENTAPIECCDDVRRLLPSYRRGTLSQARTLLVASHLRDCGSCLREYRAEAQGSALDWSSPLHMAGYTAGYRRGQTARVPFWKLQGVRWGALPVLVSLILLFAVYSTYFRVLPGVHAEVESVEGAAYKISSAGVQQIAAGGTLQEGERLRTGGGAHAVLRLTDGSAVEINERSLVGVGVRGRDTNILLENGDVIVQAARRKRGHLYVKTADLRAAVTGTIFAVDAGLKGSNVAVLQGAVQVKYGGSDRLVRAGNQMATYQTAGYTPLAQEISWSHDRDRYLPMLTQFAMLEHRLETVAFPASRYSSDLLERMPADTTFYLSIPNLGEALSQANQLFQDQLQESPELQQWFDSNGKNNTNQLNSLVVKLHEVSGYLGDEVVLVGREDGNTPALAVIADVRKSGLEDYLRTQFTTVSSPSPGSSASGVTVLDEQSLAAAATPEKSMHGEYALVRDREVAFSNSLATLREINRQLSGSPSGFAEGDFGREITGAYQRGAGIILAADLKRISEQKALATGATKQPYLGSAGTAAPRFLIIEHREVNGEPENHLSLEFAGQRQGVASWLAVPAPIGSLDFVSPNAAIAVALLSKDPQAIADDLLSMMQARTDAASQTGQGVELNGTILNLRDDLATNLGGDFLVALDGPVLPTPAWKVIADVKNAGGLEQAFERFALATQSGYRGIPAFRIDTGEADGQKIYSLRNVSSGLVMAEYTFSEGYLLVAPDHALLLEALRTRATGMSLARSASFKAQLPKDKHENYSAVAYQNLSPVLAPLLSQFNGPEAETLRRLAVDAKPTTVCVWGEGDRIEAGSNSHLLGSNFLVLAALLHHGFLSHGSINSGSIHDKLTHDGTQTHPASVRD